MELAFGECHRNVRNVSMYACMYCGYAYVYCITEHDDDNWFDGDNAHIG